VTDALQFLHADWPAPPSVHALATTRAGGVSLGPYASLNLGDHVGDQPQAVARNRALVRASLNLGAEPVWLKQVHGTNVVDAASTEAGAAADGAYTDKKGVTCAVLTADCLPIFICDRRGTEIALLHGGWRGLAAGVVEAGLQRFHAPADELLVWLGPAIGPGRYEVGEDVRRVFLAHDAQAAEAFRPRLAGKWDMDIYRVARQRLVAAGARAIYGGQYCTAAQSSLFFSHRRDGVTGRMASLIWLA